MKTRPMFRLSPYRSLYLHLYFGLLVFFSCIGLAAQASGEPSELEKEETIVELSPALIRDLEGQLGQGSPNYAQIEEQARAELGAYYKQFTQGKSIAYERQSQSKDYSKLSKNALRLLSQLRDKGLGRSYFLGEKADLFRLHVVLAKAYAGTQKPAQALSEYAMAFRYASIEPPSLEEQEILRGLRAELDAQVKKESSVDDIEGKAAVSGASKQEQGQEQTQTQSKISDAQKEGTYLWMENSFANPKRLAFAKTGDSQKQSEARRFAEEFTRYQELKKEYKKARGQAALARIKAARGQSSSPNRSDAQSQRDALKEQLEQSKEALESIRKGAYKSYVEKRREFYGDAAYRMALAVKRVDLAKHAFRVQSRQRSYLRGRGEQDALEEKTLEPNSSALRSLLELAHKINPFHLEYARLLADEYRRAPYAQSGAFLYSSLCLSGPKAKRAAQRSESLYSAFGRSAYGAGKL